jgi:hypothetical protein
MNTMRVFLGSIASLGLGLAVACSSSSGNGAAGNADAGSPDMRSSGTGSSDDGGPNGTGCGITQRLCIGFLGNMCLDAGTACLGTAVFANECSTTQPCPSGQVCCSSLVNDNGGTDPTGAMGINVSVQRMAQCPAGGTSSQVCDLDDAGGSSTACPSGTSCRDYLPVATKGLPNTLCLPIPEAGTTPRVDAGTSASSGDDGGP